MGGHGHSQQGSRAANQLGSLTGVFRPLSFQSWRGAGSVSTLKQWGFFGNLFIFGCVGSSLLRVDFL